jgi:hypothetical protein
MAERERDHAVLRVHSYGGGPSHELRQFLDDLEYACNRICGFGTVVAQLSRSTSCAASGGLSA